MPTCSLQMPHFCIFSVWFWNILTFYLNELCRIPCRLAFHWFCESTLIITMNDFRIHSAGKQDLFKRQTYLSLFSFFWQPTESPLRSCIRHCLCWDTLHHCKCPKWQLFSFGVSIDYQFCLFLVSLLSFKCCFLLYHPWLPSDSLHVLKRLLH